MARYAYTHIEWDEDFGGYIMLESTDPQVIDMFHIQVKQLVPNCQLAAWIPWPGGDCQPTGDPTGEAWWARADKVWKGDRVHAEALGFWIVKQLCLEGWEPFNVSRRSFCLRKRLE